MEGLLGGLLGAMGERARRRGGLLGGVLPLSPMEQQQQDFLKLQLQQALEEMQARKDKARADAEKAAAEQKKAAEAAARQAQIESAAGNPDWSKFGPLGSLLPNQKTDVQSAIDMARASGDYKGLAEVVNKTRNKYGQAMPTSGGMTQFPEYEGGQPVTYPGIQPPPPPRRLREIGLGGDTLFMDENDIKSGTTFKHTQSPNRPQTTVTNVMPPIETAEQKAIGEERGKKYYKLQEGGMQAQASIERVSAFAKLLDGVETGKLTPAYMDFAGYAASFGVNIDKNLGPKQAAEKIANKLALEVRNTADGNGMPGHLSDQDRKFLVNSVPNMTDTMEGRRLSVELFKRLEMRRVQAAKLARDYRAKHGKFDEGFYDELQAFANANPLFADMGSQQQRTIDFDEMK